MKNVKLCSVMEQKGVTVKDLSAITGIHPNDIYQIRKGTKYAWSGWKKKIADALGVAEAELFDDDETE